jgi:hypothetical protein
VETKDLLLDAFSRVEEEVTRVLGRAEAPDLEYRPVPAANSVSWLVWHLTRVIDDHVSELAAGDQVWHGWVDRFGFPFPPADTGYGHTAEQVGQAVAAADLLSDYHREVQGMVRRYLQRVDAAELDRIVDRRWDPPVTAGVRLVSVISDALQHAGQAAYVLGLAR